MKNTIVEVPTIKDPIKESPGFKKKALSDFKLDILALCGFGCIYCSSNCGNYLRIRRETFADLTEQQAGKPYLPAETPDLTFHWPDILDNIKAQLEGKPKSWGEGQTLVFSMLTDGFSPLMVKEGITEAALKLVLEHTSFRIRVLTKNAIVGSKKWIGFFSKYPGRFVVGLSIGSKDNTWAKKIEMGTSVPTARIRATQTLQDAGVPTFGMLCPVFPDVLEGDQLEHLVDKIRPELVEHVWAEPYNDRNNWEAVRAGYQPGSFGYQWFTEVYEHGDKEAWSKYATDLYLQLRTKAEREGWLHKLCYLLYEGDITAADAHRMGDLRGCLLQSKSDDEGRSKNPHVAQLQGKTGRLLDGRTWEEYPEFRKITAEPASA